MISVDELVDVELTAMAPRGDGIGVGEDGLPIYVQGGIVGERVRARIFKRGRLYAGAEMVELLRPSPHRVAPPCPLFEGCDGCQLQHVAHDHQLVLKRGIVADAMAAVGIDPAVVAAVIAADDPWGYRNHARFTVRHGQLGYVRRHRRAFFQVERCMIMDERINALLGRMQGELGRATQCNIRVGADADALSIQPKLPLEALGIETGQAHVAERLGGHEFRVSTAAFFQVNRAQAERMLALVRARVATAPPGRVIDAYAGVGTFAAAIADDGREVIAIEESGPAVRDAKLNLAASPGVELVLGRSELVLQSYVERAHEIAALVLDPPRSGCLPGAIEAVAALRPPVVVYVSCDPASLARDLRALVDRGFVLAEVQPLDMFPQTIHVECIATLLAPREASAP